MSTIEDILKEESEVPRFERELLLAQALHVNRIIILTHSNRLLNASEEKYYRNILSRRKSQEPIAHIRGHQEFFGREFLVNSSTLVPRPETEILIERVLDFLRQKNQLPTTLFDIGTGSGIIALTLAKELEDSSAIRIIGTDISSDALSIAKKNARRFDVEETRFLQSDLLEQIPSSLLMTEGTIIFVANLPYLTTERYFATTPDVRNFEPRTALESGSDGLDHYRRLLTEMATCFDDGRARFCHLVLFIEIDPEQYDTVTYEITTRFSKASISPFPDLSGKIRVVEMILTKE